MKKYIFTCLALWTVLFTLSGCGGQNAEPAQTLPETAPVTETVPVTETENTSDEGETAMQLIPDSFFATGFTVRSQKDHQNGDAFTDLGTFGGQNGVTPRWLIAQWDSGPCLWENRVSSAENILTDGTWRRVQYNAKEQSLSLLLDTSLYYGGKGAVQGDYWPHLLVEQPSFGYESMDEETRAYYRCDADMELSFDLRMPEYSATYHADDWVEAAQCLLYFYVSGVESNDFVWFGVQLFDNRNENTGIYCALDGGKADASGRLIYTVGTQYAYENSAGNLWKNGKPDPSDTYIHVTLRLSEYLKDMFRAGEERDYFTVSSLSELKINGMNFGWETIGTFRHEIEIKNLTLTSRPAENK